MFSTRKQTLFAIIKEFISSEVDALIIINNNDKLVDSDAETLQTIINTHLNFINELDQFVEQNKSSSDIDFLHALTLLQNKTQSHFVWIQSKGVSLDKDIQAEVLQNRLKAIRELAESFSILLKQIKEQNLQVSTQASTVTPTTEIIEIHPPVVDTSNQPNQQIQFSDIDLEKIEKILQTYPKFADNILVNYEQFANEILDFKNKKLEVKFIRIGDDKFLEKFKEWKHSAAIQEKLNKKPNFLNRLFSIIPAIDRFLNPEKNFVKAIEGVILQAKEKQSSKQKVKRQSISTNSTVLPKMSPILSPVQQLHTTELSSGAAISREVVNEKSKFTLLHALFAPKQAAPVDEASVIQDTILPEKKIYEL